MINEYELLDIFYLNLSSAEYTCIINILREIYNIKPRKKEIQLLEYVYRILQILDKNSLIKEYFLNYLQENSKEICDLLIIS